MVDRHIGQARIRARFASGSLSEKLTMVFLLLTILNHEVVKIDLTY